jgi:hypothetical protein
MSIGWRVGGRRGCESRYLLFARDEYRSRPASFPPSPLHPPRVGALVPHAILADVVGGVGDQDLAADGPGAQYGEDGKVEKVLLTASLGSPLHFIQLACVSSCHALRSKASVSCKAWHINVIRSEIAMFVLYGHRFAI